MNLITFPFAGGNKFSYNVFRKYITDNFNLIQLEYGGRNTRIREGLALTMEAVVKDLKKFVLPYINKPYAFYGHSMGSVAAYLMIHELIKSKLPLPVYLFVSGRGGPCVAPKPPIRYLLSREKFIDELRVLGGSPDELLYDKEVMDFFEPILRADFEAIETYKYVETPAFPVPVTAIAGTDEDISDDELKQWGKTTILPLKTVRIQGAHFFIFEKPYELTELIRSTLLTIHHDKKS
ncbi:MAG: thioesterase domain-containing protein [Bacteroidetes bacterium]|nr:thioesterase domain-containing protein [Bacteroidota bacterium]